MVNLALLLLVLLATTARACEWTACDADCGGGSRVCSRDNKNDVSIQCHMQGCYEDAIKDCGPADVVFILDSSRSQGKINWWRTKQFAIDITRGMNIGLDDTRVGLVAFSENAKVVFDLGKFSDREPLEDAIWNQRYMKTSITDTKAALVAAEEIFDRSGRKGVKSAVIMVTDGESTLGAADTKPQALAMHAKGIQIFAVGVGGKIARNEIKGIASDPNADHTYFLKNYKKLPLRIGAIIRDVCAATKLIECDDWNPEWNGECILNDPERNCGQGIQNKTRECRTFFREGGPVITRTDCAEIPCWGEACPPPPCTWSECTQPCDGGKRFCDDGEGRVKRIRCNVQSCEKFPADDCNKADVVFLLDSSGSIGPKNWARTKQFAMDVSKGLPISAHHTHVAAVSFSKGAHVAWSLNDMIATDPIGIENMLWSLEYRRKRTHTHKGLEVAKKMLLASHRPDAKKILIVITDGLSNVHKDETYIEASFVHNAGIKTFCLAINDNGSDEFAAIASEPHPIFLHNLKSYDSLTAITNEIIRESCALCD